MLPNDNWRWLDGPEGAFLHQRFACVAAVALDRGKVAVRIYRRRRGPVYGTVATVAQGKRYVERWLAARDWWAG